MSDSESVSKSHVYTVNELSTYQIELINFLESDFNNISFGEKIKIECEILKITRIIRYKFLMLSIPMGSIFLQQRVYQVEINNALSGYYFKTLNGNWNKLW